MATLYSDEIRQFVQTRDWPKHGRPVITEKMDPEPHLYLVFFRDHWLLLDRDDQYKVTAIVKEVMHKLWGLGIPTYVAKMESVSDL